MYSGADNTKPNFGGKIWIDAHGSCSYSCAICRHIFYSGGSFELHVLREHNGMNKPSPSQVDRKFAHFSTNRSNHNSQSNDRKQDQLDQVSSQLICTKCNKRYDNLELLRAHARIHQVFECDYCPRGEIKRYETQKGLWSHQRNKHGAKFPYKCKVCVRVFRRREQLQEHKAKHGRGQDIRCDFCPRILMSAFEKDNHIKKEHSDRRYYCFLCTEYWSSSQVNLQRHTKEKHPGLSQPNE